MGPKRILVADDNPKSLHFITERLLGAGDDVRTASDPLKITEMIEFLAPDFVILDISMPGMVRTLLTKRPYGGKKSGPADSRVPSPEMGGLIHEIGSLDRRDRCAWKGKIQMTVAQAVRK